MELAKKLGLAQKSALRAVQDKTLDYFSFFISEDQIGAAVYTKNDLSNDRDRARSFLASDPDWGFLVDKDLILFATTKDAVGLAYSYEYKLRYLPVQSPFFERVIHRWDKPDERHAIRYFAETRIRDGFKNCGIWFVGIEQPLQTQKPTLKVYFKTFYENSLGDRRYSDEEYLRIISRSPIPEYQRIAETLQIFLPFGFHLYMVSWNYDASSGQSKYKIYSIAESVVDSRFFDIACSSFHVDADAVSLLTSLIEELPVEFAGFSLGETSGGKHSINLYFRGERN